MVRISMVSSGLAEAVCSRILVTIMRIVVAASIPAIDNMVFLQALASWAISAKVFVILYTVSWVL